MMADQIAVIGRSLRVPGARTADELWQIIVSGRDVVTRTASNVGASTSSRVQAYGRLADWDLFDPDFYGYAPREAEQIDPQQRLLLDCAVEALDDSCAGQITSQHATGVFASVGLAGYLLGDWAGPSLSNEQLGTLIGSDGHYSATRIAYKLGLTGPAVTVGAACASSLVAIHLAVRAIRAGDCELALAGGMDVELPQPESYLYQPDGILSASGVCRPFAQNADGTVFASGGGLVVLCGLRLAGSLGLPILAVVRGTATNNDGAEKASFTAPRASQQSFVMRSAWHDAGIDGRDLEYLECHGTGTQIGDRSELLAIGDALSNARGQTTLGSIKANLGHLRVGAGVIGFIKACEVAHRGVLPPLANNDAPTDAVDDLPVSLPQMPLPARHSGSELLVGVNSFGFGGSNAHAVVSGYTPVSDRNRTAADGSGQYPTVLALSSASPDACIADAQQIAEVLDDPAVAVHDVAYTLACGRRAGAYRYAVVAENRTDAYDQLRGKVPAIEGWAENPKPYILLGVEDYQLTAIGSALYGWERLFTAAFDRYWKDVETRYCDAATALASEATGQEMMVALQITVAAALATALVDRGIPIASMEGSSVFESAWRLTRGETRLSEHVIAHEESIRPDLPNHDETDVASVRLFAEPGRPGTFDGSRDTRRDYLALVAQAWCDGHDVRLDPSLVGEQGRFISLPSRHMMRTSYVKPPQRSTDESERSSGVRREASLDRWTYEPSWRRRTRPEQTCVPESDRWLAIINDPRGSQICDQLENRGAPLQVLDLRLVDPGEEAAIKDAIDGLLGEQPVTRLLHLAGLRDLPAPSHLAEQRAAIERELRHGLYAILFTIQTLISRQGPRDVALDVVAVGAHPVDSSACVPERALLAAPPLVAPQDLPFFRARSIDASGLPWDELETAAAEVVEELLTEGEEVPAVCLSENGRFVRAYERVALPTPQGMPRRLRHRGVYLITGGLGGIGLTMAQYLAETCQAKLVLTGLEAVPEASSFERSDGPDPEDQLLRDRVSRLRHLIELGSEVMAEACDVGDRDATADLIRRAEERFGPINGVVHAAGVFETQRAFRGVDETTEAECVRRLWPKVQGTVVLADCLRGRRLDFLLTQSSLSAHLGGLGFYAYTAGNAFMDAYTERYRTADLPWMTMNWDGWIFHERDESATADASVISASFASPDFGVVAEIAVRPSEGANIFSRFLEMRAPRQVLISTSDFEERYSQWVVRRDLKSPDFRDVESPDESSLADIEKYLCEVWSDLLGVDTVEPNDNFFALGGDSLHGLDVVFNISQRYDVSVSVISMFDNPTVEAFAKVVAEALGNRVEDTMKVGSR